MNFANDAGKAMLNAIAHIRAILGKVGPPSITKEAICGSNARKKPIASQLSG